MAERRMFSKRVVRSAKFLKMPSSSRELYWQLGIEADDDGIVEAFNVMRLIGATEDDLKILVAKGFILVLNEDLVSYIIDWNENNKLRADRKVDSIYKDLLIQVIPEVEILEPKPRADTNKITGANRTTNGRPKDGIGKDRIVEVSLDEVKLIEDKKEVEKYFDNEDVNNIFIEFIEVRKKLKAVNSDRAIKTLINKLNKYNDSIKYQMLENSIVNSWKDVYELKPQKNNNKQYKREEIVPVWFNKEIKKEPLTPEEQTEMDELMKPFLEEKEDVPRSSFEERKRLLEERLKNKYGKKKRT